MTSVVRPVGTVLMVGLVVAVLSAIGIGQDRRAAATAEFEKRVKAYVSQRDKVEASLAPPPKTTRDPHEIAARQQTLADAMRSARAHAKPGDIFVPDVVPFIREAVDQDFKNRTPRQRAGALQEVPTNLPLKVNDPYPKSVPLATVPPILLAELPQLPETVEYRFVGRRLILHDTRTNLVVDILPDTVPPK